MNKTKIKTLLGIDRLSGDSLLRLNGEEIKYYSIQPFNIEVMSDAVVEGAIHALAHELMTKDINFDMYALDARESFDNNKIYLMNRIAEEENYIIKQLLQYALEDITARATETNSARQFLILFRMNKHTKRIALEKIKAAHASASNYGLFMKPVSDEEFIKENIALYFKRDTISKSFPNWDGEQYL